jgi:hypothetical protein
MKKFRLINRKKFRAAMKRLREKATDRTFAAIRELKGESYAC